MFSRDINNKMSIVNFFNNSKKRDLSDNSKSDGAEDLKKLREYSGSSKADAGYIFAEGLNNSSCRGILFNCLKEFEAKVVKIHEVANSTKESQIKGEKQLEDLTSSADYIAKKSDERREKQER